MRLSRIVFSGLVAVILDVISVFAGYYDRHKCFGTGDCILGTNYFAGGYSDPYNKWLTECNDGEAMIGIFDAVRMFIGVEQVWCKFMFPMKPPSKGIYPFYSSCNVRNVTMGAKEFYCYDKYWPKDTVDTFTTGLFSNVFQDPGVPSLMKCCKTPAGYHIDYSRCEWKYTHDKRGEHYDGYWLVKCETNEVMTGLGQAVNPNDGLNHFVWMQCCPVIYNGYASKDQHYLPSGTVGRGGWYDTQSNHIY
ncbi:uncharacterized protein LOC129591101 [Paramacrobiotus metropolitanus]|uniref:uncharacterized protein LOC129591101 n=1 Tax=Paramacrobiotus metropolitanus TaxID=2943436 RepID=UPI00244565F2|nr:uncharacterized protein LOC129591101 [Paramacrobiotus metropolitanus]